MGSFNPASIRTVLLRVPVSKYINRPFPQSEHEARHSFQFNACTALLDGEVGISSFSEDSLRRQDLINVLKKVVVEHPEDKVANFDKMYGEVVLLLESGEIVTGRCDTFYGHWREPPSQESLHEKFLSNATHVLHQDQAQAIIEVVKEIESLSDCSQLASYLK